MKYSSLILILAMPLVAQPSRESYREPYQAWRTASGSLEQDAVAGTADFAAQSQAASQAAQTFLKARADFVAASRTGGAEQTDWASKPLLHPEPLLAARPEAQRLLASAAEYLNKSIAAFTSVKDPAIQQVRQAMERERAALTALNDSIKTRNAAVDELIDATDASEASRVAVSRALNSANTARNQLIEHLRAESAAWDKYYKDLAEGAASAARVSTAAPTAPAATKPAIAARPSPNGQLPLTRYLGSWSYPVRGGLFFGAEPQTFELLVREENGSVAGTVVAKFVLPAGSRSDPNFRAEFSGPAGQGRTQTFPLKTAEGVTGTIQLIPGSAINLLEVNIQTGPNANKVTSMNVVLLKR